MRLNVEINGLTERHWIALAGMLQDNYGFTTDDSPRVCVVFEARPGGETSDVHVEMPVEEFRQLLMGLNIADALARFDERQTAKAALTPDASSLPAAADDADFLSRPAGADQ